MVYFIFPIAEVGDFWCNNRMMKKLAIGLAAMMLAMGAAEARIYRVHSSTDSSRQCEWKNCENFVGPGFRYCKRCQELARKYQLEREQAVRELMELLKGCDLPAAKGGIRKFFGYEPGSLYEIPRKLTERMCFDKDGELVVTNKLAKPFRQCNKVELKYSRFNLALYQITLFSSPDVRADRVMAEEEKTAIGRELVELFNGQITMPYPGRYEIKGAQGRQRLERRTSERRRRRRSWRTTIRRC